MTELLDLIERCEAARYRAAVLIDRLEASCTEDAESDPQLAAAWEKYKSANREVTAFLLALSHKHPETT